MAEDVWRFELTGIVLHPTQDAVWVDDEVLHKRVIETTAWWGDTEIGGAMLAAAFGDLPATLLRRMRFERDKATRSGSADYELEAHSTQIPSGYWLPLERIESALLSEQDADFLLAYRQTNTPVPPQRPRWQRKGWRALLKKWSTDMLAAHGLAVQAIELVRSWSLSFVARLVTDGGVYYFKAHGDCPLFANEGVVMAGLADIVPDQVPRPLVVDAGRRWMILPEIAGDELSDGSPPEVYENVIASVAQMQQISAENVPFLLQHGCVDRRFPVMAQQIETLLRDPWTLNQLNEEEVAVLQANLSRLQQLCRDAAKSPIPATILHGDLHYGNLRVGDSVVVFDWTDAAIGCPLFDLDPLTELDNAELNQTLRRRYFDCWQDVSSEEMEWLSKAANLLVYFYYAISYRSIEQHTEPDSSSELGSVCAHFLRSAAKRLATEAQTAIAS